MIENIILCAVFGIFMMLSFIIGAIVGQKVVKGQELRLPNPVARINEHKEIKEVKKELEKLDIINENIDNYNGTDLGQKEIPR